MASTRSFVAFILLLFFGAIVGATEFDWFPSTSEMVGANLPTVDLTQFNKRLNREVLGRFDFKVELRRDVQARVRSKFLDYSGLSCKEAFSNVNDFIHKVVREGLFDKKVSELLLNSNLEQRALEYLMYGSSLDDRTYSDLRQIPVNTLTKQFVERWLIDDYLASPAAQAAQKRIATHIWENQCGTN